MKKTTKTKKAKGTGIDFAKKHLAKWLEIQATPGMEEFASERVKLWTNHLTKLENL